MYLGRVVGCVWATIKSPQMVGQRMLVVQPLTPELKNTGKPLICTDCTGAGAGELVYWVRGKEASFPFLPHGAADRYHRGRDRGRVHVKRPVRKRSACQLRRRKNSRKNGPC